MSLRLEQTCGACPEQYNVFDEDDRVVGYMRLRWGSFYAEHIDEDGERTVVYRANPEGDGMFEPDERDYYLTSALRSIENARRPWRPSAADIHFMLTRIVFNPDF